MPDSPSIAVGGGRWYNKNNRNRRQHGVEGSGAACSSSMFAVAWAGVPSCGCNRCNTLQTNGKLVAGQDRHCEKGKSRKRGVSQRWKIERTKARERKRERQQEGCTCAREREIEIKAKGERDPQRESERAREREKESERRRQNRGIKRGEKRGNEKERDGEEGGREREILCLHRASEKVSGRGGGGDKRGNGETESKS